MLAMPARSRWDLNFRALGIPVRISPWFWLVTLLLSGMQPGDVSGVLIWIACVFVSILIHEYGHGLTASAFGYRSEIVLYGMGGLCSSGGERQAPGERLAITFAGPGFQFILLGLVCVAAWIGLGITWRGDFAEAQRLFEGISGSTFFGELDPQGRGELRAAYVMHNHAFQVFDKLFYINLMWPLLNLLPIYPLDGGQISQVLMTKADWRNGPRRSHIVSMVVAGVIAAFVFIRSNNSEDRQSGLFMVFFFAGFAFLNYQMLQAYHQGYVGPEQDDADWWKR